MKIPFNRFKIFAAPRDTNNDFASLEEQLNAWMDKEKLNILDWKAVLAPMTGKDEAGRYILTVVVRYEC